MAEQKIQTILAVDCGNVTTTAVLITCLGISEQQPESYRLLGCIHVPSTHGAPWNDITVGIQEAMRQLEQTGKSLLTKGGRPIMPRSVGQQGVDAFIAVSSAAEPLPIALVGLIKDITLASARRAAMTSYSQIVTEVSLDAEDNEGPKSLAGQLRVIREAQPEVILLVGGTDGGASRPVIDMANLVAMALHTLPEGNNPVVLYAGNITLRSQVAEILGSAMLAVDNVRPSLHIENLAATQLELERLYVQRKMVRLSGMQMLNDWTSQLIAPTSKSFEKAITYLGQQHHLNIIGADIGSGTTMVSGQAKNYHGSTICSDAGIGHSLGALLKLVPLEKIQRWLPFEFDLADLHNMLLNKSLQPASIPTNHEELMIEYALGREALRLVIQQARTGWPVQHTADGRRYDIQWDQIVGAGRILSAAPHPGYAAMLLLDAIEPWGVTNLMIDKVGLTSMLGAIALAEPQAAVEVIAYDTFLNLGTVIAPAGHGTLGKTALKVKIEYATGESEEFEIPHGVIETKPLAIGEKATLEIHPTRSFDMLPGQLGQGVAAEVSGGVLGLIFDTRGRPLQLAQDNTLRYEQLTQWYHHLIVLTK